MSSQAIAKRQRFRGIGSIAHDDVRRVCSVTLGYNHDATRALLAMKRFENRIDPMAQV